MGLVRIALKPLGCLLYLIAAAAVAFALLAGAGIWAANRYAPEVLRNWLETQTGYSVSFKTARLQLLTGDFEAEDIRIFNPSAFGEPSFIEGGHLKVDADPLSFIMGKTLLVHEIVLKVDRLHLVFNQLGTNNFYRFLETLGEPVFSIEFPQASLSSKSQLQIPQPITVNATTPASLATQTFSTPQIYAQEIPDPPPPPWRIACFRLEIRQVRVHFGENNIMDWPLNYKRTFSHITDADEILTQLQTDLLRCVFSAKPAPAPAENRPKVNSKPSPGL